MFDWYQRRPFYNRLLIVEIYRSRLLTVLNFLVLNWCQFYFSPQFSFYIESMAQLVIRKLGVLAKVFYLQIVPILGYISRIPASVQFHRKIIQKPMNFSSRVNYKPLNNVVLSVFYRIHFVECVGMSNLFPKSINIQSKTRQRTIAMQMFKMQSAKMWNLIKWK